MAISVLRSNLTLEQKKLIQKELTFQYKENKLLKKEYRKKQEPKEISCFINNKTLVLLPFYWAESNFNLSNAYKAEKRNFKSKLGTRDEKQQKELDDVIQHLKVNRATALTIRTGAGKTAISLFCACRYSEFTVVLVHIGDHCTQWLNSINKYTTAKGEIVTSDMNGVQQETDILICLYTRWMKVPSIVRKDIGLLIIDECDEFCNPTGIESVLNFEPKRILACTATFKRTSTGLESMMHQVVGYDFVSSQFDIKFSVTKIMTGISGHREPARYTHGVNWFKLNKSLLYNEARNKLIVELVKIRYEEGMKSLILTTEIDHVMLLYGMIKDDGIKVDYLCENKKTYTDGDVLVGTEKKCGRGFDEESFCESWGGKRINNVIIVCFIVDEARRIQNSGRGMRAANPNIDQLVDNDKTVMKQWDVAEKIYTYMGAEITEVEFCDK